MRVKAEDAKGKLRGETSKMVSLPRGHTVHVSGPSGRTLKENTRPIS